MTHRFESYQTVAVQPLTLTRNFGWVVGFCTATLIAAPLFIGWAASVLLK